MSRIVLWNGPEFSSCRQEQAAWINYKVLHHPKYHPFLCKFKKDSKTTLPVGTICLIVFGIVFGIMMSTIYFILWRRSQRKKAAKKREQMEAYELQQRYVVARCDSIAGTEVGSVHSDATVVQQVR